MLRRLVYTFIAIIALYTASYGQLGYRLDLNACVKNDTLFVDFIGRDTLIGGPSWAFASSNFVIDVVSGTNGPVGSGLAALNFGAKQITYSGPWSAAQNPPDYLGMGLGATVDSFLNVTIVHDTVNAAGVGYVLTKDSSYIIATVALPLNPAYCGDTISLKWRYKNRSDAHTWNGKALGFGSGDINRWGDPVDSSIQQYAAFYDLLNVTLCDCGKTASSFSLTSPDTNICAGDTVNYTINGYFAGDSVYLFKFGSLVPFAKIADSVYSDTLMSTREIYAYIFDGCVTCGQYSDTLSVVVNPAQTYGMTLDTIGCDTIEVFVSAGWDSLFVELNLNPYTTLLAPDTSVRLPIVAGDLIGVTAKDTGSMCPASWFIDTVINAMPLPPVVDLGMDTTICSGDSLILDAGNFAGIASYNWNLTLADTNQLYVAKPLVTDTIGVVIDSAGCVASDSIIINVSSSGTPSLDLFDTVCTNDLDTNQYELNVPTTDSLRWYTQFGTGSIIGQGNDTIQVAWNTTGDTLWVVQGVGVCADSAKVAIFAKSPTVPVISGQDTICTGDTTHLSVFPQNALFTYDWTIGGTTVSTDTFYNATTPDSIIVELRDLDNCTGFDTIKIDTTNITGTIEPNLGTYCAGDSILLYTTSTASGKVWMDGAMAIIGTGDSLFVKAIADGGAGPGTYYLLLTEGACTAMDSTVVTESGCAIQALFTKSADTVCIGGTIQYTNNSVNDTARIWDFGATYPNDTSYGPIAVTYTTVGWNYTDLFVFGAGGLTDVYTDSVFVQGINQQPVVVPTIVVSDSVGLGWAVIAGATDYEVSYSVNNGAWNTNISTGGVNFYPISGLSSLDSVCYYVVAISPCNSVSSDTSCLQTGASNCNISFSPINPSDICIGNNVCFGLDNIQLPLSTQPNANSWKISWEGQVLTRDTTYCITPSAAGPGQIEFTIVDTNVNAASCYSNGFLSYTVLDTLSSNFVSVGIGKVSKTKVEFNWLPVPGATNYVIEVVNPPCYSGPGSAGVPDTVPSTQTTYEVKLTSGCTGAEINAGLNVGILVSAYNACDSIGMQRDTVTAPATDSCFIGFVKSPNINTGCEGDTLDVYLTQVVISYQGNSYFSGFEIDWYNTGTYEAVNDTDYFAVPGVPGATLNVPFTIRADSVSLSCPVRLDTIRITTAAALDPGWEVKTDFCLTDVLYQLNNDVSTEGGTFTGVGVVQVNDDWYFDASIAGVGTFFITTHHVCGADSSVTLTVSDVPCVSTVFTQDDSRPDGIFTTCDGEVYFSLPGQNSIWKIDTLGIASKLLGDSSIKSDFDGHISVARVNEPRGLVVNEVTKDVYFCDSKNHKIKKYVEATKEVITISGSSTNPSFVNGAWPSSRFDEPWGMTADCDLNNLYVTDKNNFAVRKIEVPDGGLYPGPVYNVSTLVGGASGYNLNLGPQTGAATLMRSMESHPTLDGNYLYIPDPQNLAIYRYDILADQTQLMLIRDFFGYVDGLNTGAFGPAAVEYPVGSAIQSGEDWIYFSDQNNYSVRTINDTNILTTVAGGAPPVPSPGEAGGPPLTARFGQITAMRYSADGFLYVCDQTVTSPKRGTIRKIAFDRNVYGPFAQMDSVYCLSSVDTLFPPQVGGVYTITSGNVASLDSIGVDTFLFAPVDTGWYTLSYTAQSQCCSFTDTFNLYVRGIPVLNLADTTYTCDSSSTILDADTMPDWLSYQWLDMGDTLIPGDTNRYYTATDTGYFTVSVTDTFGCIGRDTTFINFSKPPVLTIVSTSGMLSGDSVCLGTPISLTFDSTNFVRYFWNTSDTTATITTNGIFGTGDYIATAADSNGCTATDTFRLIYRNLPFVCINTTIDTTYGKWAVGTLAGSGGTGLVNGNGLSAEFAGLWDVYVGRRGLNLAVSSEANHNVLRSIRLSDTLVSSLAGTPPGGNANGMALGGAAFNHPYGIYQDINGDVFFADRFNHVVRKLEMGTGVVTTVAGQGPFLSGSTNFGTDSAYLNSPFDLTGDIFGNLYMTDFGNHWIRKIDTSTGVVDVFAGRQGALTGTNDGVGFTTTALEGFNWPTCIDRDFEGNLYNTDNASGLVRKTTMDSVFTTIGSGFSNPWGITVDPSGVVYVVEQGNHVIHALYPNGSSEIIAGQNGTAAYADGIGTAAAFNLPRGIDVDKRNGKLYLADYGNNRIRTLVKNKTIYLCQGDVDTLNGSCSIADSMRWEEVISGTIYPQGPTLPISAGGTYVLTIMKDGCLNSDTVHVVLRPSPVVNINGGLDTIYACQGDTVMLFDTAGTDELFTWTTTTTFINPLVTLNDTAIFTDTSGTYYLDVLDTVGGCSARDTIEVIFSAMPAIALGNDTGFCFGDSLILPVMVSANDSIIWNDTLNASTYTVTTLGLDTIWGTVYSNRCFFSDTMIVNIVAPPVVDINMGVDTMYGCFGDSITLYDTVGSINEVYTWTGTSSFIGAATDSSVIADSSGTYYLSVLDTVGNCSVQDTIEVILTPAPTIALGNDTGFCFGDSLILPVMVSANDSIIWNDTLNASTYTVTTLGLDTIWGTVYSNGCFFSDTMIVNIVAPPVVDINMGVDTMYGCFGDSITLYDTVGSINEVYTWTGTSSFIGAATDSSVIADSSGTYYLSVLDTVGNCSVQDTIEVILTPAPTIALGNDTGFCFGGSLILPLSASLNDSVIWNDTLNAATFTVSSLGTDTIWGTVYSNGCFFSDTVIISIVAAPVVDINGGADTVYGCTGDTISLYDTVGSVNEIYTWTGTSSFIGAATDSSIIADSSGTYYLDVLDTLGKCATQDTIEVILAPAPSIDLGPNAVRCLGNSITLPLTVSVNDSIIWNDTLNASTFTISNLGLDTVWATVYSNGCSYSDTVVVNIVTAPIVNINAGLDTMITCQGITTTLYDSVGSINEVYTWSGTNLFNGLATDTLITTDSSGTYYLEVTDTAGGCTGYDTIEVMYTPSPFIDLGADTGGCGGFSITLPSSATAPNDSIVWSGALGTFTGNTYTANMVNTVDTIRATIYAGGCSHSDTVVVASGGAINVNAGTDKSFCAGTFQVLGGGLAAPTASGGSGGGFSYQWFPSSFLNDSTLANPILAPGNNLTQDSLIQYVVIVTDTLTGCTATDTVKADLKYVPVVSLPDTILCKGESWDVDLSWIQAACPTCQIPIWSVIGFIPAYVVSVGESEVIIPPPPVTFNVLFIQNGTCFYKDTTNLIYAADVVASIDPLPKQCYQDSVTIGGSPTASGGSGGPYTHIWTADDPLLVIPGVANPVVQMLNPVCYTVEVVDQNPTCRDTATQCFTVTIPPKFTNSDDTTLCRNDSIPLQATFISPANPASAGLVYGWSSPTGSGILDTNVRNTIGWANPGDTVSEFIFQVLDTLGCTTTGTDTVTVSIYNPPVANFVADSVCNGETTTLYSTSTDGTDSVWQAIWNLDNPLCNPNVVGDTQYIEFCLNPNLTDTFYVTLTVWTGIVGSTRCIDDTTIPVIVYGNPYADAGIADTFCPNVPVPLTGMVTADSGSGPGTYTYLWTPTGDFGADSNIANPTAYPNPASTQNLYTVQVTDANGCTDEDTVTIHIIDLLAKGGGVDAGGIRDTLRVCRGELATLGAFPPATGGSAPYRYKWSTGPTGGPFSPSDSVDHPTVMASVDTNEYWLRVDDAGGCFDFDTVTVVKVNYPAIALVDTGFCWGDTVELARGHTVESGVQYQWTPNVFDVTTDTLNSTDLGWVVRPLQDTVYVLTASLLNPGCILKDTIRIRVNSLPVIDIGSDGFLCVSDTFFFNPTVSVGLLGTSHSWTMGPDLTYLSNDTIRNPFYIPSSLDTNTFYLTVSDSLGCTNLDSIKLWAIDTVTAGGLRDTTICSNEPLYLNMAYASGKDSTISWTWIPADSGSMDSTFILNPVYTPSLYTTSVTMTMTVTNSPCPVAADSMILTLLPAPDADFVPDPFEIFIRDSVYFGNNNTSGVGGTYTWVIEGDTIVFTNDGTTTSTDTNRAYVLPGQDSVFLWIVDTNGCVDTAFHMVDVIGSEVLFVPNVFSPQASHIDNTALRVFGTNIALTPFQFEIFNRWGERIFVSNDFIMMNKIGWDGTVNGIEQEAGVYTYTITGQFVSGFPFDRVGNVTLIR